MPETEAESPCRNAAGPPGGVGAPGILGDIQDPRLMYLKAALFLVAGTAAAAALFLESPTIERAFLLATVIWSFCRLYYFMFYVIEKYVDGKYRFAGVHSFLLYLLRRKCGRGEASPGGEDRPRA